MCCDVKITLFTCVYVWQMPNWVCLMHTILCDLSTNYMHAPDCIKVYDATTTK